MKNALALIVAIACHIASVRAETQGSAMSSSTDLDLTVGPVEYALADAEKIPVEYGSLYSNVEGGMAQFLVNDAIVASGGEAATYDWKPTVAGTYVLKHRMIVDGEEAGMVLTVTHIVTADPESPPTSGAATSAPIALDLVAAAASYVLAEGESVPVEYGALYGDVEAGQTQLILNGAIMRTGGWASVYDLKPAVTGVYDLVHRIIDNGVVTGTVLFARVEVTAQREHWIAEGHYGVRWKTNAVEGDGRASWLPGRVYQLPPCTETPPSGKHFAGWLGSNGKRYDDRMLVFDVVQIGEVIVLTPVWE